MPQSVVLNGQKLDLSANPDLLLHILLTLTNLEEKVNSFDKRLHNLEKRIVIYQNIKKSDFLVVKST